MPLVGSRACPPKTWAFLRLKIFLIFATIVLDLPQDTQYSTYMENNSVSDKMLVYRFEYEDGGGIYCGLPPEGCKKPCIDTDMERHPQPQEDSFLRGRLNFDDCRLFYFGFHSLVQLRSWFYKDEWLVHMADCGVVIAEYDMFYWDVVEGHSQTMFIRCNLIGKNQHNILKYFGLEEK